MMHFESKTIINKGGEIIIEMASEQELLALKNENDALKTAISNLGQTIHDNEKMRAAEREGYRHQYNALAAKFDRCQENYQFYYRLFNESREKIKAVEKEWRGKFEINHLEHMELRAWRKTEKARKKARDRLRSRVKNIRKRKKVNSLIVAANDFAVASRVERELDIPEHRLEISNAIIALAEYLHSHNPSEELQTYLWDCRTVEALLNDIRASIVRTAFGVEWESRILSGLTGLNVIAPTVPTPIVVDAPKQSGKGRRSKKRPA